MTHRDRTTPTHDHRGGGFTLVELLVAMAVTLLLLLFINGVFSTLSTGVSAGLATSEVVHTSRAINSQINRDAQAMVGPEDDGVLIITNQWIGDSGDPITPFGVPFTAKDFPDGELLYQRRADQLTFIRTADGLQPMTPQRPEFLTPARDVQAAYARVNYGHALRVTADGYDNGNLTLGVDTPNNLNRFAAQWVLGRQALLLATDLGTADIYAEWALSDPLEAAPVWGHPTGVIYEGYTDIAAQGFQEQHESNDMAMVGGEVDENEWGVRPDPNSGDWWRLFRNLPTGDVDGFAPNDPTWEGYFNRALGYTYTYERLRVNPRPLYLRDIDTGDDVDRQYPWWQIMQMHPILATGVTDFIVEFAGDYEGGANAGRVDVVLDANEEGAEEGRIRWYSMDNIYGVYWDIFEPYFDSRDDDRRPIFREVTDRDGRTSLAMVFRHGPVSNSNPNMQTNWPHLIRIRYRLTDEQARLTGQDDVPGRMYEQIIRVPRPQ